MKKEEILSKLGNLADKATVIDRKGRIEIPFHRLGNDWKVVGEKLATLGFQQGPMSFYATFDKEQQPTKPTMRDTYEQMSEAEQIKADLRWIEMDGWLSEEKLARLEKAGYKVR